MCDSKHMLLGLSDGSLYNISWKGEVISQIPSALASCTMCSNVLPYDTVLLDH